MSRFDVATRFLVRRGTLRSGGGFSPGLSILAQKEISEFSAAKVDKTSPANKTSQATLS